MKSSVKIINYVIGVVIFFWLLTSLSGIGHFCQMLYSDKSCASEGSNNAWLQSFTDEVKKISKNSCRIQLKDITPFAWEELHVLTPYTTDIQIITRFGFHPKLLGCTRIYTMDDRNLLVFRKNNELVAFGDIPWTIMWPDVYIKHGTFFSDKSWFCPQEINEDSIVLEMCTHDIGTETIEPL